MNSTCFRSTERFVKTRDGQFSVIKTKLGGIMEHDKFSAAAMPAPTRKLLRGIGNYHIEL
jgi:hypothetical protein